MNFQQGFTATSAGFMQALFGSDLAGFAQAVVSSVTGGEASVTFDGQTLKLDLDSGDVISAPKAFRQYLASLENVQESDCRALTVWDDSGDILYIEKRLQELEPEVAALRAKIAEGEAIMQQSEEAVSSALAAELEEAKRLEAEMEQIIARQVAGSTAPHERPKGEEDDDAGEQSGQKESFKRRRSSAAEDAEMEELLKGSSSNRADRRAAKKVYKQIAGICHPDKTANKELHEIFLQAKEHMEATSGNLQYLTHLYNEAIVIRDDIKSGKRFRTKKLTALQKAEEESATLSKAIVNLQRNETFKRAVQIKKWLDDGKQDVFDDFIEKSRASAKNHIEQMRSKIKKLREMYPEEVAPAPKAEEPAKSKTVYTGPLLLEYGRTIRYARVYRYRQYHNKLEEYEKDDLVVDFVSGDTYVCLEPNTGALLDDDFFWRRKTDYRPHELVQAGYYHRDRPYPKHAVVRTGKKQWQRTSDGPLLTPKFGQKEWTDHWEQVKLYDARF